MAASSSSSQGHDVFPSFRGEDVRATFLSHLLMALDRRSINSFSDNGIERSRPIGPELLSAIREARISIVIFSKNYPSSTWCLNELVEIHKCYKEFDQMVIPVFYDVDPSHVRKQTGEFGKAFEETCMGKPEDQKQRWRRVLTEVASMAGEDLRHYNLERPSEAYMVEKIANDVSNKLISPSNCFGEFVGIEAHLEAMNSILCLDSKEARMVGIWGTSGIGKSTIGRALFSQLSSQFPLRNFVTYKSTDQDVFGMKSSWEQKFLSEILGQKDLKIENLGGVEQRLKDKKVLIVLDDVDNLEFLKTLVGKTEWFGPGSRIIVITQNRRLLKAHDIDLLYEVKFPSQDLALKMLCRSAFGENSPPDDFKELAVEVATLARNLPLGLSVLGSFLKRRGEKEWTELLDRPQNGLNGDIMKTLSVGYNRLDEKDQYLFLYIACLLNGHSVKFINDFLGDVNTRLQTLADKSLIRITPDEIVEMHNLLEKLGTEINRAESKDNPGKRRFLTNDEEILDVFTDKTGTGTVLGIFFNASSPSQIKKPFISIDEKSFEGMLNLQFLKIHDHSRRKQRETRLRLPNGLVYLPRKLKLLEWNHCPLKCLPSNFKAEYLIELRMEDSELEKLWEGTQLLGSLKKMIMNGSKYFKEIPDLSKAINLEYLDLIACPRLKNFPEILMQSFPHGIEIEVEDCLWNKNLPGLDYLDCFKRSNPSKFRPEHLVHLTVKGNMLEKLWEGVQSLGSLESMDLSECGNLTEIPDLSKATNLRIFYLSNCKSLLTLPFTIGNLQNLLTLEMKECTGLEVLPVDVNLSSLKTLDLSGCSSLRSFPQISSSIKELGLDDTAIEQVPCCVENFSRLTILEMRGCKKLKNISPNIFRLTSVKKVDFTNCGGVITALSEATVKKRPARDEDEDKYCSYGREYFNFQNCFKLDGDARELILRSCFKSTMVLPGGEVPTYFKHRAYGNSLTVMLPQSSFSHKFLRFNACVVVKPVIHSYASMSVHFRFNGKSYMHTVAVDMPLMCNKTDHLVLCSFKFWLPSKLDFNDVEFRFIYFEEIKECGIRLLNVSPYPDDSDGSSETEYNQQSGEKCDVVETENSKKRMRMTLDTGLTAPNLELLLGRGESSSVSSYPCLEGEALCVDSMITEQQDAQIPIAQLLYDVFLSFHREDVRNTFLCHLLKELDRRSINTSINEKISIGRPISDLLLAIKGARISIVIFSKNYPSSRWCLNELVEIHKSYKKFDQIVMPVFYNVDPSDVRKQTGEFGKAFVKTCMGNPEDQIQRWSRVLSEVASMAGGDFRHYSLERPSASGAHMVEKIANDVSNKLISPSYCFG